MDLNIKDYVNWKMSHDIKYAEAEGYPLMLEKCRKNKELKDLKIYGNSVQNGTPTPDNPIEVESVGELTIKNILDIDSMLNAVLQKNDDGTYSLIKGTSRFSATMNVNIPADTKFAYSVEIIEKTLTVNTDKQLQVQVFFADGSSSSFPLWDKSVSTAGSAYHVRSFAKEITSLRLFLDNEEPTGSYVRFKNLQIEIGDKATEYEPFHKYKIPIKARGKNLFDYSKYSYSKKTSNGLTCEHIGNGIFHIYGTVTSYTTYINFQYSGKQSGIFKKGKKYKSQLFGTSNSRLSVLIGVANSSDVQITNITTGIAAFTIPSEGCYTRYVQVTSTRAPEGTTFDDYIQLQLEEETFTNTYEPYIAPQNFDIYLDEPLRKVGSFADYIDFEKGAFLRNIKVMSIKGITWNKMTDSQSSDGLTLYRYSANCSDKRYFSANYAAVGDLLCEVLRNSGYSYGVYDNTISERVDTGSVGTGRQIRILTSVYATVSEMLAAFGNFNVHYILATPTEEEIELPKLPKTKARTMVYEIGDTSVQPSDMYTKYIKKS